MVDCKRVFILTEHHNLDFRIVGVYDSYDKASDRRFKEIDYRIGQIGFEYCIDVYEIL